jgi:hypothetical protein
MLQGGRRPGQRVDPELGSLDLAPELICKVKRLIAFSCSSSRCGSGRTGSVSGFWRLRRSAIASE